MIADIYRHRAADLRAKARSEESEPIKRQLENLAQYYLLMAEQAERSKSAARSMHSRPTESTSP